MYAALPNVPPPPIASVLPSIPDKVNVLLAVKVLPDATDKPVTVAALPVVF